MNKKTVLLIIFILCIFIIPHSDALERANKYLIILQAGKKSPDGMARAIHALLYAKELKGHGHAVALVFDGAGTEWVHEWSDPKSSNKYKTLYAEVAAMDIANIICDYCAGAFGVKDHLRQRGFSTTDEYSGHPSIAKWADAGFQIIVI